MKTWPKIALYPTSFQRFGHCSLARLPYMAASLTRGLLGVIEAKLIILLFFVSLLYFSVEARAREMGLPFG